MNEHFCQATLMLRIRQGLGQLYVAVGITITKIDDWNVLYNKTKNTL